MKDWKQQVAEVKASASNSLFGEDRPKGLQIVRTATKEAVLELKAAKKEFWDRKAKESLTSKPFANLLKKVA